MPGWRELFALVSWRDPALSSASVAGLVNNLNDGLAWGLLPIFLASRGLGLAGIAAVSAAYPLSWGVLQLGPGALSDRWGRRWLIVGGMALQALSIWAILTVHAQGWWLLCAVGLGLGTAMVYPTLLAAVGDVSHPSWRASTVGVYRFWRDLGYAVGALTAGAIADIAGIATAIAAVGGVTMLSALITAVRLRETLPSSNPRRMTDALVQSST